MRLKNLSRRILVPFLLMFSLCPSVFASNSACSVFLSNPYIGTTVTLQLRSKNNLEITGEVTGWRKIDGRVILDFRISKKITRQIPLADVLEVIDAPDFFESFGDARPTPVPTSGERQMPGSISNPQIEALNNFYFMEKVLAEAAGLNSADAISLIYRSLLKNYEFQNGQFSEEEQRYYRDHPLRHTQESSPTVGLNELLYPDGPRMKPVMEAFAKKLDSLIKELVSRASIAPTEQVYLLAVWAKRTLVELQPGVDGNFRAGHALFNYVLARVRQLKHFSNVTGMSIDFTEPKWANVTLQMRLSPIKTVAVQPFRSDFKVYLSENLLKGLAQYAEKRNLPFYQIILEGSVRLKGATPVTADSFADGTVNFSRAEFDTVQQFLLDRVSKADFKTLTGDRELIEEMKWIRSHQKTKGIRF